MKNLLILMLLLSGCTDCEKVLVGQKAGEKTECVKCPNISGYSVAVSCDWGRR